MWNCSYPIRRWYHSRFQLALHHPATNSHQSQKVFLQWIQLLASYLWQNIIVKDTLDHMSFDNSYKPKRLLLSILASSPIQLSKYYPLFSGLPIKKLYHVIASCPTNNKNTTCTFYCSHHTSMFNLMKSNLNSTKLSCVTQTLMKEFRVSNSVYHLGDAYLSSIHRW